MELPYSDKNIDDDDDDDDINMIVECMTVCVYAMWRFMLLGQLQE